MPRVLLRFVGGEEREVLPPHVARELRDVLLVADAQIHGVPTKPEVRMILRIVLLIQRLNSDVQFYFRRHESNVANAFTHSDGTPMPYE